LSIVVVNNEDPIQQSMTTVCAASPFKVRLSKLLVAFCISGVLGLVGMIGPPLASTGGVTGIELLVGGAAQLLTALTGTALGGLCSRPLIARRAWSVLIGTAVCLLTVIVPHCPPTRQILVLLNETGSQAMGLPVLLITVETVAISGMAVVASLRLAHRMS